MFLVAVLFFGVACSALLTSEDGVQCLHTCAPLFPGATLFCEGLSAFVTCWKPCPSSPLDAVVLHLTGTYLKQCLPSVSEEQREKFVHSRDELDKRLTERALRCEDRSPKDDEAFCKNVASCELGSALDELKDDYPKDVVTAVTDWRKVNATWFLKNHRSPPQVCFFLYVPYEA